MAWGYMAASQTRPLLLIDYLANTCCNIVVR